MTRCRGLKGGKSWRVSNQPLRRVKRRRRECGPSALRLPQRDREPLIRPPSAPLESAPLPRKRERGARIFCVPASRFGVTCRRWATAGGLRAAVDCGQLWLELNRRRPRRTLMLRRKDSSHLAAQVSIWGHRQKAAFCFPNAVRFCHFATASCFLRGFRFCQGRIDPLGKLAPRCSFAHEHPAVFFPPRAMLRYP